jgi:signal transduction histidine kinase
MAELRRVSVILDLSEPLFFALSEEETTLLISNLLLNALQHSGAGSRIDISARVGEGWVEFVVRDQGEGIDAAALPHVFERFYRGDPSRTRSTGGTGLGLSICKAVVDAAKGEIQIASERGKGTTATVRLPAGSGEPAAAATRPSA